MCVNRVGACQRWVESGFESETALSRPGAGVFFALPGQLGHSQQAKGAVDCDAHVQGFRSWES